MQLKNYYPSCSKLWELERKYQAASKNHDDAHNQILHVFNSRFNKYPAELTTVLQKINEKLDNRETIGLLNAIDVKTEIR